MELAAAQQPLCDVGGLKRRPFGRRMGRKVARHRDQNVPARTGVAPFAELPHARLQHLVGVEARILTEQSVRECRYKPIGRVTEREMARDQTADQVDLPLAIESLQQSRADVPDVGRKVVQPITAFAWQPIWRHVEVTGEVEGHCPVQHPTHRLDPASPLALLSPDPLQDLVYGIGIREDVQGRLPVSMLVGSAEPRHAERRRIGERTAEIGWEGAGPDGRLQGLKDRPRIIAQERDGQFRVIRPAGRRAVVNSPRSSAAASSQSATRSTGWRQAVVSSAPRAATIWSTTLGSTAAACSQPIRSRHSQALLMKSSTCPPLARARSVAVETSKLASTAGGAQW